MKVLDVRYRGGLDIDEVWVTIRDPEARGETARAVHALLGGFGLVFMDSDPAVMTSGSDEVWYYCRVKGGV